MEILVFRDASESSIPFAEEYINRIQFHHLIYAYSDVQFDLYRSRLTPLMNLRTSYQSGSICSQCQIGLRFIIGSFMLILFSDSIHYSNSNIG